MKFTLSYYDREVKNNLTQGKKFVHNESKKQGLKLIEEYLIVIKELFESLRGFESISKALSLNKDTNEIEIDNRHINFKRIFRTSNVVLYFEVNSRIGFTDMTIGDKKYYAENFHTQVYDSPFIMKGVPVFYPEEIGAYRVFIANNFEYNNIKDKSGYNKKAVLNKKSTYYFDFLASLDKLISVILTYGDLPGYPIAKKEVKKIKIALNNIGFKK